MIAVARMQDALPLRQIAWMASAAGVAALLWLVTSDLPHAARATLLIFATAMAAWILTPIDDTAISVAAALALVAAGATTPAAFYAALGNELVWLMIATFMISVVLRQSQLADEAVRRALTGVSSVRGMFYILTAVVFATAFVIPSTTARGAIFLPVYLTLTRMIGRQAVSRGLALLFPTVILLSASGVLTGAGAHLVAVELLGETSAQQVPLDYLAWLKLMLPIAVISCLAGTELILRLIVGAPADQPLDLAALERNPLDGRQRFVAMTVVATVALWIAAPWHGASLSIVAVCAALLLTQPRFSGVSLKEAARGVEWPLVLFFAATILLGEVMLTSGAGEILSKRLLDMFAITKATPSVVLVAAISVVALLAHLVVVSRSARCAILLPTLALPLSHAGFSPASLALLTVVGTGFCQTLPVSAKSVALFTNADDECLVDPKDLARLAMALLPIMLALMLVFALLVWPQLGVHFSTATE